MSSKFSSEFSRFITRGNVSGKEVSSLEKPQGLSQSQVRARQKEGRTNNVKLPTSRSYLQILRENLFTFMNAVFLAISCVFIILGSPSDAFFVGAVIFSGAFISLYQEIWAKRKLDKIALLTRPVETVIRDGQEFTIEPGEVVQGDILRLRPGDQILVDGEIVGDGRVEIDESLLTGESDLIAKKTGQPLYSGSFCVSGTAYYEAQKVGKETVAYNLMVAAREFRRNLTPLQQEINVIIRVLSLIVSCLWFLLGINFIVHQYSIEELVQRSAVIAGLIPAGILITITLAYVLGAVQMLGKNVLIQQTNAVESLSHVDVLCLDKTGTLTNNYMTLENIYPLEISESKLRQLIGNYAASTSSGNRTIEAILTACPNAILPVKTEVPFASARKWSAIVFDDSEKAGTYILGAPETLFSSVTLDNIHQNYIQQQVNQGLRVLLFAYSPKVINFDGNFDGNHPPRLPSNLIPLGILSFAQQLRPSARETLQGFVEAGIAVKIISGDNADSVAQLAQQAGFSEEIKLVSGQQLETMNSAEFASAAIENNVFGRVTPEQKGKIIRSIKNAGHYVAMIGDGVNDILSLKQANLAIAMESGSKATRAIADIVLLKDSFEALPEIFVQGQKIRNGIQDVFKLFITRLSCVTLLIIASALVTDYFPLRNKHSAIVSLISLGLPSTFIPVWAKPTIQPQKSLIRSMVNFVVPAILSITFVSLGVYLFYFLKSIPNLPIDITSTELKYQVPRTALVTILVFCQLMLILFLKPPTTAWVAGERLSGDWRYSVLAFLLLIVYFLILLIPAIRDFFELSSLAGIDYLFLGLVALVWSLTVRWMWRNNFWQKMIGNRL
ncbi:MAG: cation-translocating P-type ATPase [Scytonematopsis contorta HA4267-MV1]|nr:cation-translocating P-type ATPase [Scytonematopsis contorta HA4267-MV1]